MKILALVVAVTVAALSAGLTTTPVTARSVAAPIPTSGAVVTLLDFDFFATSQNPVGVAVDRRGDILTGILFTGEILTVTPDGRSSHFATLPVFPAVGLGPCEEARPGRDPGQDPTPFMTGFALHTSGDLYVGLPNCDPDTHGIWRVKPDGSAEPFASVPLSQLPKGLAFSKNGHFPLYVTDLHDFTRSREDCAAAMGTEDPCTLKIWSIDRQGNVSDWMESTLFYGDPDSPLLHPHGVNGIVVDKAGENVYVTVTDFGRVVRIPINRDGSAGEAEVIFEDTDFWGIDGITIGPDENIYIVNVRTAQLAALPPDGSNINILVEGHPLDGPTQLIFGTGLRDSRGHGDGGVRSLPPLYVTSGAGRSIFELFFPGFTQPPPPQEPVFPRPSLVRVLLDVEK